MKKILFTTILLISMLQLSAQSNETEKTPRNYIGINAGGNYHVPSLSSKQKEIQLYAAPFYGYKVKKFVLGLGLNYGFQYATFEGSSYYNGVYYVKSNLHELSISPIIRYYTKKGVFITSSFLLGIGKQSYEAPSLNYYTRYSITYENRKIESQHWGANLGIGYAIKAGKSFLIEPLLSYNYINRKITSLENNSGSYNILSDFNYGVRINIIFGLGMTCIF